MTKAIKYYTGLAERMVKEDRDRNLAFEAYDQMYHAEWELPAEIRALEWIRKETSSDPHDAIDAATQILSGLEAEIKMQPLQSTPEGKKIANDIERNLKWQLWCANRRRSSRVEADVVRCSLMYMATAANVVDLDHHIKLVADKGGDTKMLKRWRKTGRFVVNVFNPKDVHVLRNSLGVQAVLLCQKRYASEVVDEWGSNNGKLKKLADEGKSITYYDFTDHNDRAVWAEDEHGEGVIATLLIGEHELDFLPWAAIMGGEATEDRRAEQFHPMLYSIWKTGQWITQNIGQTLVFSKVITKAGKSDMVEEGSNPDNAVVDYTDPALITKVPPGNTLKALPDNPIDRGMMEIVDRIGGQIQKSTLSSALQGGALPSGTAFSTLNLKVQTDLGALKPAQDLAQRTLAEILTLMMLWVNQTGVALEGYGMDKSNLGTAYQLEPDEIPEENLYISVKLKPDVPTDRMQQANTASMMTQWGYSWERALEDMGVEDPPEEIKQWMMEKITRQRLEARLQAEAMLIQGQAQLQIQQAQMGMQQQAQGQQMQQQAQIDQQKQAQEAAMQMEQEQGMFPGGQGYNPAAGGTPMVQAAPSAMRETMQGADISGNPLASQGQL